MTTDARALERLAESTRARRIAPSHPLIGQLAKGGAKGYSAPLALQSRGVVIPARRRGGLVGGAFMVLIAVAMMLWVLGFGLSGIASLIMSGS